MRSFLVENKRTAVCSLAAVGAAMVCFAGLGRIERVYASANRVALTATTHTSIFNREGVEVNSMTTTLAIRSDGSLVKLKRETDRRGREVPLSVETREIHDVQNRSHVEIHPSVQSKITMRMDDQTAARLGGRPAGCADAAAADSKLLGFPVVKKTRTTSGAPRQQSMTVEEWVAPGLDCLPLKTSAVLKGANGAVISRNTEEVVSVRLGEPEASLFEVPGGLIERAPSEVMAADYAQRGGQCSTCVSAAVAAADENYARRHK